MAIASVGESPRPQLHTTRSENIRAFERECMCSYDDGGIAYVVVDASLIDCATDLVHCPPAVVRGRRLTFLALTFSPGRVPSPVE